MAEISKRYEFVYLFDVENGSPNGDPATGGLPRIDPETNHGLVTGVCLKRKIRNYVDLVKEGKSPYEIYVQGILNHAHKRAYRAIGVKTGSDSEYRGSNEEVDRARAWMCANFYDVRTFGAVMSFGFDCGHVRGPVQLTFSESVDPIVPGEMNIPYGLYRAKGHVSAFVAGQTGFSTKDLDLLWEALRNMFERNRKMSARKLFVFKHDNALGNAHAHELFDLVEVKPNHDASAPAREFGDYKVSVHKNRLPDKIEFFEML
jgi:CRISPR-associated protein Csd2